MSKRRLKLLLWSALLALIFIGASSVEQTALALPEHTATQKAKLAFVFDLNGVLFDTSKATLFRQLGIQDVLWYLARYRSAQLLKTRFFKTLHQIAQQEGNPHGLKDSDGSHLPLFMAQWLTGAQDNEQLRSHIVAQIEQHPEWFMSATEQRLIKRMTNAIFDPQQFVASRKLLPDLIPLITALKKRGITLYVLSNWDKESFALLQKKYNELFSLFDGAIISGEVGHAKPHENIYAHLKNQIPDHLICFLDDQPENIQAGKEAGLHTILVRQTNGYLRSQIDIATIIAQSRQFIKANQSSVSRAINTHAIALS